MYFVPTKHLTLLLGQLHEINMSHFLRVHGQNNKFKFDGVQWKNIGKYHFDIPDVFVCNCKVEQPLGF